MGLDSGLDPLELWRQDISWSIAGTLISKTTIKSIAQAM